jgi:hypothetical protein
MGMSKFRQRQIKFCCSWLNRLSTRPHTFRVIKHLRQSAVSHHLLAAATGPFRPFVSLSEAASAIAHFRRSERRASKLRPYPEAFLKIR